jgi:hypothetical protein
MEKSNFKELYFIIKISLRDIETKKNSQKNVISMQKVIKLKQKTNEILIIKVKSERSISTKANTRHSDIKSINNTETEN